MPSHDEPETVAEFQMIIFDRNGHKRTLRRWGVCDRSFEPSVWLATLKFGSSPMWTINPPERLGLKTQTQAEQVLRELWAWRMERENG